MDFFVGLFSRKGTEIGRKHLGSVVPGDGIVNEVLSGSGRWVRGHSFRLQVNSTCFYVPKGMDRRPLGIAIVAVEAKQDTHAFIGKMNEMRRLGCSTVSVG